MSQEEIRTIGVRDIPKYQAREDVIWIDVREREEYVLYCERGSLSMMAAKQLLKDGYSVCTLIGGIRAVQERNLD